MNPDCYVEAADRVLQILCDATGHTPGVNAFQFFLPPIHTAFAVSVSGGGSAAELAQCTPSYLRMGVKIEGRFLDPQSAMRFVVAVLAVVPVDNDGRVQRLHLVEVPTVEAEITTLANQDEPALFYKAGLGLEVVFSTGD